MTYKLVFLKSAKKEWDSLDVTLQKDFKNKLEERINNPFVLKDKLSYLKDCYKLKPSGYRLVYRVFKERIVIQVIVISKRERNLAYKIADQRLKKKHS